MEIRERLAISLGRNDEAPNIELAREIAADGNATAISDLIALLDDPSQAVRSDALKVLYETGKLEPALIGGYGDRFAGLLTDRHNRMIWGGMEALASVARVQPGSLLPDLDAILQATERGSVITRDWGVRVLASIAIAESAQRPVITRFLLEMLESCRASEFPRHLESMQELIAADKSLSLSIEEIANRRLPDLTGPQTKRMKRVLASLGSETEG